MLIRPSAKKKEPAAHIEKPKIESSSISEKINKKSAVIENKNDDEPISDKISDNQDEISELKVNELASIDTVTNSSQETLNPPSPQPFSLGNMNIRYFYYLNLNHIGVKCIWGALRSRSSVLHNT